MIEQLTITGVRVDLDTATKKYVARKIARLDRYLPKHARKSVSAEVVLKQINKSHGNKYEISQMQSFTNYWSIRFHCFWPAHPTDGFLPGRKTRHCPVHGAERNGKSPSSRVLRLLRIAVAGTTPRDGENVLAFGNQLFVVRLSVCCDGK